MIGTKPGSAEFPAVGRVFGAKTHTLAIAEMPVHNHPLRVKNAGAATYGEVGGGDASGTGATATANGSPMYNTGGGGAHNNIQPSRSVLWAIKF